MPSCGVRRLCCLQLTCGTVKRNLQFLECCGACLGFTRVDTVRVCSRGTRLPLHFAKCPSNVYISVHGLFEGVRWIRSSVGGCQSINEILHAAQRARNPSVRWQPHVIFGRQCGHAFVVPRECLVRHSCTRSMLILFVRPLPTCVSAVDCVCG